MTVQNFWENFNFFFLVAHLFITIYNSGITFDFYSDFYVLLGVEVFIVVGYILKTTEFQRKYIFNCLFNFFLFCLSFILI